MRRGLRGVDGPALHQPLGLARRGGADPGLRFEQAARKDETQIAHANLVAHIELGAVNRAAIDERAVAAAQVPHEDIIVRLPDLTMMARYQRIGDDHIAIGVAPDHETLLRDGPGIALLRTGPDNKVIRIPFHADGFSERNQYETQSKFRLADRPDSGRNVSEFWTSRIPFPQREPYSNVKHVRKPRFFSAVWCRRKWVRELLLP